MRTFLLILATVVVIAAGTGIYVWMQPVSPQASSIRTRSVTTRPVAPPPRKSTTDESQMPIGEGRGAFFTIPDEKTNTTAWQFRTSRYEPQADNSINVSDPEAEFFFSNGQMIRLTGTRGRVVVPSSGSRGTDLRGPMTPPSRGELYDVTISLFHMDNRTRPMLVCTVNNVSFDNDTFRIATEAFTQPDGTVVPADQVPVQVRGDDYNFDGRGLTIRWDDKDRRLQLLQIAHGESLEILSQSMLKGLAPTSAPSAKPAAELATPSPQSPARSAPGRGANAARRPAQPSAASRAVAVAPASSPTTKKAVEQPVYRAIFEGGSPGGVTVERGEMLLAMADTLQVDLKQQPQEVSMSAGGAAPPPRPATRRAPAAVRRGPTTRRRPADAAPARQARPAAPRPAQPAAPPPAQTAAAGTASNDQEEFEPVVVRWSGPLTVVPLETADAPAIKAGDYDLTLSSKGADNPVVLHNLDDKTGKDTVIECAWLLYHSADDGLVVRSSPDVPMIRMSDSDGGTFFTPSLVYGGEGKQAVLEGASRAEIPIIDEQSGTSQMLKANWSQRCVLTLIGADRANLSIESAKLSGDVDVDHPSIKLKSDTLQVEFESAPASTTKPADGKAGSVPRELIATGHVICDIIDTQQQRQNHIRTDELHVMTTRSATGQLVPSEMSAVGNVHTYDVEESQGLWAGRLRATLAPTTRPTDSPKLERVSAQENVRFVTGDGSGASDFLDAVAENDDYNLTLQGSPAVIRNGESELKGPRIDIKPKRQFVEVAGAGSMHGLQQGKVGEKPTPFDATWDGGLVLRGQENFAQISGDKQNVVMTVVSASDGAVNTLSGAKVVLELMDDPAATQPSKKTASTTSPTSKPGSMVDGGIADSFSGMRKKALRTATVTGDTKMRSLLAGPNGAILRQLYLEAPVMTMDAQARKFIIPAPGRMLFDQSPPSTQPTTQASTQPASTQPLAMQTTQPAASTTAPAASQPSAFASMKGPTAFEWKDRFTFDQSINRAEMAGNVKIVHGSDPLSQDHFTLVANTVQADFADQSAATRPADAKTPESDLKLKMLSADGDVHFDSTRLEFIAPRMSFDPATETLAARGNEDVPVRFWTSGVPHGSVLWVTWNTRTWDFAFSGAVGQFGK
jgi:lipopolysaccharide export system protein LptA